MSVTTGPVILRWWQDEHGCFAVNDALNYSAGGPTYADLRERVQESAECEGWDQWVLLHDQTAALL